MDRKFLETANRHMFNKKEELLVIPSDSINNGFKNQKEQIDFISNMLTNLYDLGYEIPSSDISKLFTMSCEDLKQYVYTPVLEEAKRAKGAHVEHKVLFPGFPDSVKSLDIDTLSNLRFMSYYTAAVDAYFNMSGTDDNSLTQSMLKTLMTHALQHIPSEEHSELLQNGDSLNPATTERLKELADANAEAEKKTLRQISISSEVDYYNMIKNMLSSRSALSDYDKEIVLFAVDNFNKDFYMPEKIRFRETQALLDKHNFEHRNFQNIDVRTVKDFERLLATLSDGDVTLSKKQHYKNFSNQDRNALTTIFTNAIKNHHGTLLESMANDRGLTFAKNVLTKRLHMNQHGIFKDFMQEAKTYKSVMSRFEEHMKNQEYEMAAKVLAQKSPTLLMNHAREIIGKAHQELERLNSTFNERSYEDGSLAEFYNRKATLDSNIKNAENIVRVAARATNADVLLKVMNEALRGDETYKIITPKNKSNIMVKENTSVKLTPSASFTLLTSTMEGLDYQHRRMKMDGSVKMEKGTKVYIDPNLSDCPIPTGERGIIGKNRTVATGTKIPMEGDVVRVSLYKKHKHDQFIDLSCAVMDKNYQVVGVLAWNNLKMEHNGQLLGYASGDSSNCSHGFTEAADVNITAIQEVWPEAEHLGYAAIMWNGVPTSTCDELFMTMAMTDDIGKHGDMDLRKAVQEKVFKPDEVQLKVDISGDYSVAMPMMYSIKEKKAIVTNIELCTKQSGMSLGSASLIPLHFPLPENCECLENYKTELSLKCFAANQSTTANIGMLASSIATARECEIVDRPELADVIFAVDRAEFKDERPAIEGVENPERKVVTVFDKDIIMGELMPDAKAIYNEEQKAIAERRAAVKAAREELMRNPVNTHSNSFMDRIERDF